MSLVNNLEQAGLDQSKDKKFQEPSKRTSLLVKLGLKKRPEYI